MAEFDDEEPVDEEDAAQQQQSAAVNMLEPAYEDDFEDNTEDLAAALTVASSNLGAAAALATGTARDGEAHLLAGAVQQQQQLGSRVPQPQQQQQQQQHHVYSHAGNLSVRQKQLSEHGRMQPAAGHPATSSQQDVAQLLTQVSYFTTGVWMAGFELFFQQHKFGVLLHCPACASALMF
jgi:hypothetical protein